LGATAAEVAELLAYNGNQFNRSGVESIRYPLPDEPFVEAWRHYAEEVAQRGSFSIMTKYLVQLRYPIQHGISRDPEYLAATRQGRGFHSESTMGFVLKAPDRIHVSLHSTPAGHIPVIIADEREDFEALVRALARRNELVPVPASMGACMVAGYINWQRAFRAIERDGVTALADAARYQDRFILLSRGYYSGVTPRQAEVTEDEWRKFSLAIRREHECTHYFTRRVFSSMRNNVLDEILADYCGIVSATGGFRPEWMLLFFGLEDYPNYRSGARLENYKGNPPLSPGAWTILQGLVKQATMNLAKISRVAVASSGLNGFPVQVLVALSALTLEEMASAQCIGLIVEEFIRGAGQANQISDDFQDRQAEVCDSIGDAHA
jgi:hypothetical protein